jgi:malic enzyme
MFLDAAKTLAANVTAEDLGQCAIYPRLSRIRDCSHAVACAVIRRAVKEGYADPDVLRNLEECVRRAMWFPEYLPIRYEPHGRAGVSTTPTLREAGTRPRAQETLLVGD